MSDPETGEASVPLPPSVGYDIEEEEEEEDDGPPGIAPLFKRDKGSEEVSGPGRLMESRTLTCVFVVRLSAVTRVMLM